MVFLQGSIRLCNWLSLWRLVAWINHLPPACWSTFWKTNFKQQLGCRFDIMDNESYFFVFWHMQLYMSWYIRSFFGFTFLNILYFFKYSCTNIFHRRSLYTFYKQATTQMLTKWVHELCPSQDYMTMIKWRNNMNHRLCQDCVDRLFVNLLSIHWYEATVTDILFLCDVF